MTQQVPDHRVHADLPRLIPGVHLWVMVASWQVNPEAMFAEGAQTFMDLENMLSVDGPGCLWCERPWTPTLAASYCPGTA